MHLLSILLIGIFSLLPYSSGIPDSYPVPEQTQELLFYIQRNHNKNTIIYDANYDEKGWLKKDKPIDAYWKRYEEQNQRMELRRIELWYAFGVSCEAMENKEHAYHVHLVADEEREIWIEQEVPFQAKVFTKIKGKRSELKMFYIQADNSGIWPTVEYIELFGKNALSGQACYEKIVIED